MLNIRRSCTPDYGSYVRRTTLLQQHWWESGTSLDRFLNPLIYTASQPGYHISVTMPWTWHMLPHQAQTNPCKSLKIVSAANIGHNGQRHQRAADCPQIPWNRVAASMDERTHHRTSRHHKIHVASCHTRNNTDRRTFGCNSSLHYNVLRVMRGNRYITASTNCLRGRTSDMDLNKNQVAAILRIYPKHIPGEWTLRPTFHHCPSPPQSRRR